MQPNNLDKGPSGHAADLGQRTDGIVKLASCIHANPAAYAVLFGSGTSYAAGVMTGWDIAIDLVRRLAKLETRNVPEDPRAWYRGAHGEDVDYSRVLEHLAPAPGDRQALLDPYFEPTEEEREQGRKLPTRVHRALAALVATGHIRIIITTNFDRLIERALQDNGIEPLVIASADQARSAPPLHSRRCVVIKVHGDRMSPDIKNTLAELDTYEPELAELLQRVLRDYGLIVCGWSAAWDPALRNLILVNECKVYTTFWAHRGDLAPAAQGLIKGRVSVPIAIQDADSFLDTVAEQVAALHELTAATPVNADIAVAQLKRYLADPTHRIRMHDLMHQQVEQVVASTSSTELPVDRSVDATGYLARIATIELVSLPLCALLANLGYFANDDRHDDIAVRSIARLATANIEHNGQTALLNLQRYRALLGLFALGLGALGGRRLRPLARALRHVEVLELSDTAIPLACKLTPTSVLKGSVLSTTPEFSRHYAPGSGLLHSRLRQSLATLIPDNEAYDGLFDDLEYLLGATVMHYDGNWAPVGRFQWRRRYRDRGPRDGVLERHRAELLAAGLFDASGDRIDAVHRAYEEYLDRCASP